MGDKFWSKDLEKKEWLDSMKCAHLEINMVLS